MLWYAHEFRERFALRLNSDGQTFRVWEPVNHHWLALGNTTMGTATAAIKGSMDGHRVNVSTHTGHAHTIFIVNTKTNKTVARITVKDDGALDLSDNPIFRFEQQLPTFWQQKTLLVLGVRGPFTMNLTDIAGKDEEIIRYKEGYDRIYVPSRYQKETCPYDYAHDTGMQVVESAQEPSTSNPTVESESQENEDAQPNIEQAEKTEKTEKAETAETTDDDGDVD